MLRARKRVYIVKYFIEAVQTGESDFEMDSDTSESSDEEVDEDAGPVDEQNQTPIDCPAHDDEDVEATKSSQTTRRTPPRHRYRWLKKDFPSPCTAFSGSDVTSGAVFLHTPLENFQTFVSENMIQPLTENTNECSFQKNGTYLNTNNKEIEQMRAKRGRPPLGSDVTEPFDIRDSNTTETCDCSEEVMFTTVDVHEDLIAHFPVNTKRGRGRHRDKGYTNTLCRTCGVCLCCFLEYPCT